MNNINTLFLDALGAALKNEQLREVNISSEELQGLLQLAEAHQVLPMVFEAVYGCAGADVRILGFYRLRSMQLVAIQTQKTAEFLPLLEQLRSAGAKPLVVKGIVCRNLYPKPDFRLSSDEDLLIAPEQTALCHDVLTKFGLQTQDPNSDAYELGYHRPDSYQYIELHRSLFPQKSEAYGDLNRFFADAHSRAVEQEGIATLHPTDHILYLILHAFKHFLHSGFGIRQVCDLTLFANAYGSQIDWKWVLECCRQIRAEKFAAAMFRIGRKYLNFSLEESRYPLQWQAILVDEVPLLEDILGAGVYGGADMSRKHSSRMTLEAVSAQNRGEANSHGLLKSLFPTARELEGRYPYLKSKPMLLPVAWTDRLVNYYRELAKTRANSPAESIRIGNERIDLLKQYGILEKS